jgi:hypothetical protein
MLEFAFQSRNRLEISAKKGLGEFVLDIGYIQTIHRLCERNLIYGFPLRRLCVDLYTLCKDIHIAYIKLHVAYIKALSSHCAGVRKIGLVNHQTWSIRFDFNGFDVIFVFSVAFCVVFVLTDAISFFG